MGEKDNSNQYLSRSVCLFLIYHCPARCLFLPLFFNPCCWLADSFAWYLKAIGLNQREHASGVDERPLQRYHRSLFWGTVVLSVSCCSFLVCFFVCCR